MKDAINTLKDNESPGSDGYPADWYKMFKDEQAPLLLAITLFTVELCFRIIIKKY